MIYRKNTLYLIDSYRKEISFIETPYVLKQKKKLGTRIAAEHVIHIFLLRGRLYIKKYFILFFLFPYYYFACLVSGVRNFDPPAPIPHW